MTNKPNTHLYISAIDGLPVIAIAAAFSYHLCLGLGSAGLVGVDVLFVMSISVVCHAVPLMRRALAVMDRFSQFRARILGVGSNRLLLGG